MTFPEGTHPIWSIIRLTVIMLSLTGILYLTAQSFDATEIKTLIASFVAIAGAEGLSSFFVNRKKE